MAQAMKSRAGEFSGYIDATTVGAVRSALSRHSRILVILLVCPPCTLEEVAEAVTAAPARAAANLERHFCRGEARLLLPAKERQASPIPEWSLPIEPIPPNTPCHALYLPPFYLLAIDEPEFWQTPVDKRV